MFESDLSAEVISKGLGTEFIGKNIIYLPVCGSTMDIARDEAKRDAPEGTVVIADEQTQGRGRIKRAWLTPKGSSIAMSVILRPDITTLSSLIMVASLGVAGGIRQLTGLSPQIKWPNDVLIKGKKVSGILIENGFRGSAVDYAVIGIGVNVNLELSCFPEISGIATSLSDETGKAVSRSGVVWGILAEMEKRYLSLEGENTVFEDWRDNLITLGRKVRVTSGVSSGGTAQDGVAESVERDGSLLLRRPDGSLERIIAEDVTLRE